MKDKTYSSYDRLKYYFAKESYRSKNLKRILFHINNVSDQELIELLKSSNILFDLFETKKYHNLPLVYTNFIRYNNTLNEILKLLITRLGPLLNEIKNENGKTVLHIILNNRYWHIIHFDIIKLLLNYTNLDLLRELGLEILYHAYENYQSNKDVIELLSSKLGITANYKNNNNQTILHFACDHLKVNIINSIIKHAINDEIIKELAQKILEIAVKVTVTVSSVELIEIALKYGANPGDKIQTILELAIKNYNLNILEIITPLILNMNKLEDGATILDYIFNTYKAHINRLKITRLLLQNGACPNILISNKSLLYIAYKDNDKEMVKLLIEYGALSSNFVSKENVLNIGLINKNFDMLFIMLNGVKHLSFKEMELIFYPTFNFIKTLDKLNQETKSRIINLSNNIDVNNLSPQAINEELNKLFNDLKYLEKIYIFIKKCKNLVQQIKNDYIADQLYNTLILVKENNPNLEEYNNTIKSLNSSSSINDNQKQLSMTDDKKENNLTLDPKNINKLSNELKLLVATHYANSLKNEELKPEAIKFTVITAGANKQKYENNKFTAKLDLEYKAKIAANSLSI